MKKLFLAIAASLSLLAAAAQTTTTETHFAGERITGVDASSNFEVILVKSNQSKAVVEVSDELKRFVSISHKGDGIVSVGVKGLSNKEQEEFNRLRNAGKKMMHLTLYLPTLNTIRLSSSASLRTSDSFDGEDLDILTSSAGAIRGELKVTSERVKVQGSSSSQIENLILAETTDLTILLSSSARATVAAPKLANSKLGISSSASLNISGTANQANWSVSSSADVVAENVVIKELNLTVSSSALVQIDGSGDEGIFRASSNARILAEKFAVKELTATASSGASVRVNVSGTLSQHTSSGGSVSGSFKVLKSL